MLKNPLHSPLRIGILFGLLILGTGFLMGGILGKFHEDLEAFLRSGAEVSQSGHSQLSWPAEAWAHKGEAHKATLGEEKSPALQHEKVNVGERVSWGMTWLTRFHIHAVGLGMAILLLSLFAANGPFSQGIVTLLTWVVGLAGFLHPFGWLLSGVLVRTHDLESALQAGIYIMAPTGGILIIATAVIFWGYLRE